MSAAFKYLIILLVCLQGFLEPAAQEISFAHLTVSDGLSTNFVNTVAQDQKGFIWIGSENGLQRYDGNTFVSINSGMKGRKLPGLPIDQVIADSTRKTLWLRMGTIVGQFNPVNGEFNQANIDADFSSPGNRPILLFKDSRGHIILLVSSSGALVYEEGRNSFESNPKVLAIPKDFTLLNIFENPVKGWFYLCGKEGLRIFESSTGKFYDSQNNPSHIPELSATARLGFIWYVFIDSKGRFWVNASARPNQKQLFLLDRNSGKLMEKELQPNTEGFTDNFEIAENHGRVFCYGANLLNLYDESQGRFRNFITPGSVQFSFVKKLFSDRDENLWIITDNGLYEAIVFGSFRHRGQLEGNTPCPVTSILPLGSDKVLITSWGEGARLFDFRNRDLQLSLPKTVKESAAADLSRAWSAVYRADKKRFRVGFQDGQLADLDTAGRVLSHTAVPIFSGSTIRQVIADAAGNFWYGTQAGSLIRQSGDQFREMANYAGSFISKLLLNSENQLWVCTEGAGLHVIDAASGKELYSFLHNEKGNSIGSNRVRDILQLNDSIYVIALDRNLNFYNSRSKEFKYIGYDQGLPNNTIYSLVKDQHGQLWMSTNIGVVKFNYQKQEYVAYSQKDGLVTVNNNDDIFYASASLNSRYIMFAGEKNNYIIFHPDSIGNRQKPHDVTVTDIRIFNRYVPVDSVVDEGGLRLGHQENSIGIKFTALTYGVANSVDYFYRLIGASDIWIRAQKPFEALYASLAPGDYVFEVKAVNEQGLESAHISRLHISIATPYWKTWWFIGLMLILGFIPLYVIYRLRINRIRALQGLREKVARDLHDDVGATLTSINILSEMSKAKMDKSPAEVKSYLGRISDNSSQMMEAMDDIVWSIKPSNDTMDKIEARMLEYAANIFETKDIAYRFTDDAKVKGISLNMGVRRSLFLIYKETLNNIVKYARPTQVNIDFSIRDNALIMGITDDGVGFETTQSSSGNGIENMRKRAAGFKGSYTVKSYPGKGTHVELCIPLTRNSV